MSLAETALRRSRRAGQARPTGRGTGSQIATIGLSALALGFLALPVVVLVAQAILGGALRVQLGSLAIIDALVLSLGTTAASLLLTILVGTPLAFMLARRRFGGAAVVEALVDLPIVLPPSVAGLALLLTFGRKGFLGGALETSGVEIPFTTLAVVLAQTFVSASFYVRAARAGFASVEADLEDAARVDGASELAVFRLVTVPLASTALAAGLVMSWARALGEFGATIMFAGNIQGLTQTLPLVVYSEFQSSLEASIAAAAILVLAGFGVLVAVRMIRWRSVVAVGSLT